jgi:1-acyl-sn-glycerol-3-phosphate acyltransferase
MSDVETMSDAETTARRETAEPYDNDAAAPTSRTPSGRTRQSYQGRFVEESPVTRRSSPLPEPTTSDDLHIPPLPKVTVEGMPNSGAELYQAELVPGFDLDGETAADIAPVGPTEPRQQGSYAPDSERSGGGRSEGADGFARATVPSSPIPPPPARVRPRASAPELEQQIRDLEARLDRMMRPAAAKAIDDDGGLAAGALHETHARSSDEVEPNAASTTRELFSTDYYLRQWGRAGMRSRTEEVDEFGLDPAYEQRFIPLLDFLYKLYFRVDAEGTERIPAEGRCLIVSNHSGGPLPYDGVMLRTTLRHEHPTHRELRWLAEDFIYYLPFVGAAMNRLGAVRACPENAERLLQRGRAVAVFPEGAKGIGKLYRDRYRLQRFGRGGFIRLCLRTATPIIPCAVVGAEESSPMLYRLEYMTKALGIPYVPITPTFPALGPLGLLPAPTKWKVRFGEPLSFAEYGPEAADDDILVSRLSERVRTTIQGLLDRTLAKRRSIWFG